MTKKSDNAVLSPSQKDLSLLSPITDMYGKYTCVEQRIPVALMEYGYREVPLKAVALAPVGFTTQQAVEKVIDTLSTVKAVSDEWDYDDLFAALTKQHFMIIHCIEVEVD